MNPSLVLSTDNGQALVCRHTPGMTSLHQPPLSKWAQGLGLLLAALSLQAQAAPVAVDDARTILVNTSVTLNPLANDYHTQGSRIAVVAVGEPGNGTASVNADGSVRYIPDPDFVGVDQFTYTIEELDGEALRANATITITVNQRLLGDQTSAGNSSRLGSSLDSLCSALRLSSDGELGSARRDLLERCNALDDLSGSELERALRQITPEETLTQMRIAADSTRLQVNAVGQRLQQLHAGTASITLNGLALAELGTQGGGAGADGSLWSRLGTFVTVQYDKAERDQTALENGYDYGATSLTVGVDYRLDSQRVVGVALGLTRNDLRFSDGAGKLETDIVTLLLFGSLQHQAWAFDLQVGYSGTQFDAWRQVSYTEADAQIDETLRGSTYGSQWLFSSQAQWEWQRQALSLYPFARLDYVRNDTKGYGERGNSGLAMTLGRQSLDQLTLAAGVQANYAISRPWGVLLPSAELTLLSDLHSNFDPVTARFAYDPDPDNRFNLQSDGGESQYLQVAVGASALFARGWSGFFQYRQLLDYSHLNAYQVQAGVRYEF